MGRDQGAVPVTFTDVAGTRTEYGTAGGGHGAILIAILLLASSFMGCLSYSSYQDARIVPDDSSQATLAVSVSSYKDPDYPDAERVNWYPVEFSPRFHVASWCDAAFKISYLFASGEENDFNALVVLGGDVRFALVPDYLVFALPVSLTIGEYAFSTIQIQPGVVLTIPVADELDINGAARGHFFTGEELSGDDDLRAWGFNAGLGWHVSRRWTLRPEVGWLLYPESDVLYTQYGIGFTNNLSSRDPD